MLGIFALDNKWTTDLLNFFFLTAGRKKLWHLSNLNRRVQIDLGSAVRLRLRHLIGGAVTYRVENASGEARIDAATGVLTPVRVGTVSVIAAKAGNDEFNDAASAPFVLTITPTTPAGAPQYTRITKDGNPPALTLAGSSLQPSCTIRAAAASGGSISPAGEISVPADENQTFAIAPEAGYVILRVLVDGENIGAVDAYTFEKIRTGHSIEAVFAKARGGFVDVLVGSYYEDAVTWAAGNEIAAGMDETHFSPDASCTRAYAMAFLWRAAVIRTRSLSSARGGFLAR